MAVKDCIGMRGRFGDPRVDGEDVVCEGAGGEGEVDLPDFGRDVREVSCGVEGQD